MAKVLQACATDGITWTHTPGEVSFSPLSMCLGTDGFSSSEEDQVDGTVRIPGVYSGLGFRVNQNTLTTANTVVRSRLNGANGNQSVTVPAGATGIFKALSGEDIVASGDKFNIRSETDAGGSGSAIFSGAIGAFKADSGHVTPYGNSLDTNLSVSASTLYYLSLAGNISANTVLQSGENIISQPGIFSKAQLYLFSNPRSSTTTFRLIVNGVATALTITVPAGATGLFEETATDISISSLDKVCWGLQTGSGTGALGLRRMQVYHTATSGKISTIITHTLAGVSKTAGQNIHAPIGGCIPPNVSNEAAAQCESPFKFKATNLRVGISANPYSGNSTVVVRKDGVDTVLSITVPAGATGVFEKLTDEVLYEQTEKINHRWTGGTSGTGGSVRYFQLDIEDMTPSGSHPQIIF